MSPAGRVKPDRARAAWLLGVIVGCALIGVGLVVLQGSVLPFNGWPSPDRPGVGKAALAQQRAEAASAQSGQQAGGAAAEGAFPGAPSPTPLGTGFPGGPAGLFGTPLAPLQSIGPTSSDTINPPSDFQPAPDTTPAEPLPDTTTKIDGATDIPIALVDLGPGSTGANGPGQDPRLGRAKSEEGDDAPPVDEAPAAPGADNPVPVELPVSGELPVITPDVPPAPLDPPVTAPSEPVAPSSPSDPAGTPSPDPSTNPDAPGTEPPAQGETPPASGETPPDEGETPPAQDVDDDEDDDEDDDHAPHQHDGDHDDHEDSDDSDC